MIKYIYLSSKKNKTKYKSYKINLYIKNYKKKNYNMNKFGIYIPKLNIFSCIYHNLLLYLKQGIKLNKTLYKIIIYYIKKYKI
uniref:Uncharacterized protein n=1 Tax=Leucocytozoon caulleryi TaxID=211597 RepID=U3TRU2_LEUCU|nr:hypothetical protein [Leucocytozoon caulleryi]BAN94686.1 hypothetical protein [Leucocytozoon caulleryi]